jgi:transglutaminase-like putative cysteine protease
MRRKPDGAPKTLWRPATVWTKGTFMIRFDLSIQLRYEALVTTDFLFKIQPPNTRYQKVRWEQLNIVPAIPHAQDVDETFGNRCLRIRTEPGELTVNYDAIVDVEHHVDVPANIAEHPVQELPAAVLHYVLPSRYCPSDRMVNIAMREFGHMEPGYERIEAVRRWVTERTTFRVGSSHSGTCALDTFDSQVGVCRDFAHLMIAMCRALNVPARFATSIDYGADPALGPSDFHSYVEVYLDHRWYIFDPSAISPRMGLMRIATGRDASDVAFATIFGTVRSQAPLIRIDAEGDSMQQLVAPFRHDYALSTDPGFAEDNEELSFDRPMQARPLDISAAAAATPAS